MLCSARWAVAAARLVGFWAACLVGRWVGGWVDGWVNRGDAGGRGVAAQCPLCVAAHVHTGVESSWMESKHQVSGKQLAVSKGVFQLRWQAEKRQMEQMAAAAVAAALLRWLELAAAAAML